MLALPYGSSGPGGLSVPHIFRRSFSENDLGSFGLAARRADVEKGVVLCLHVRQRYGTGAGAIARALSRSIDRSILDIRRILVV